MNPFMNLSRLRLRALPDPFAKIKMRGQAWKVMYPLREVLFLVRGTIASGDDYDDIVDWGNVSGQVAVAPQRSVMNSRRRMLPPGSQTESRAVLCITAKNRRPMSELGQTEKVSRRA
jgi:hypothetical protein